MSSFKNVFVFFGFIFEIIFSWKWIKKNATKHECVEKLEFDMGSYCFLFQWEKIFHEFKF